MTEQGREIVKVYRGDKDSMNRAFVKDSIVEANNGFYPVQPEWVKDDWRRTYFFIAFLLTPLVFGLVMFLYLYFRKPECILRVTFVEGKLADDLDRHTGAQADAGNEVQPRFTCPSKVKDQKLRKADFYPLGTSAC